MKPTEFCEIPPPIGLNPAPCPREVNPPDPRVRIFPGLDIADAPAVADEPIVDPTVPGLDKDEAPEEADALPVEPAAPGLETDEAPAVAAVLPADPPIGLTPKDDPLPSPREANPPDPVVRNPPGLNAPLVTPDVDPADVPVVPAVEAAFAELPNDEGFNKITGLEPPNEPVLIDEPDPAAEVKAAAVGVDVAPGPR